VRARRLTPLPHAAFESAAAAAAAAAQESAEADDVK